MAKSKPNDKAKKQARKEAKKMATSNESPEQLYAAALTFIEQQQPAEAFQQAQKLYEIVQNRSVTEAGYNNIKPASKKDIKKQLIAN